MRKKAPTGSRVLSWGKANTLRCRQQFFYYAKLLGENCRDKRLYFFFLQNRQFDRKVPDKTHKITKVGGNIGSSSTQYITKGILNQFSQF